MLDLDMVYLNMKILMNIQTEEKNYCEIIIKDEPEIITEEEFCDILKIIHTKLDEKLFSKFAKSK